MKNTRSFISGMVFALVLVALIGTASGISGRISKELVYNNISVVLDGENLDLSDAQGNPVEPFIIDGTNYLPVRAISEALGLTASWDGETNTIILTSEQDSETEELISVSNGVRFYYTGITERSDGWYDIKIRCENDSDYRIFVYPMDFTINGKSVNYSPAERAYSFECTVDPGRSLDTVLSIDAEWFEENEIKSIRRFNARFAGYDTAQSGWTFETGGKNINIQ